MLKSINLTLEGNIVFFKTIIFSKKVFQALLMTLSKNIITEILIFWVTADPKINHDIVSINNKQESFKNLDVPKKTMSFQCSWIMRLYLNPFQ